MSPLPPLTPELIRRALAGDPFTSRSLVDHLLPVVKARVSRVLSARSAAARGRNPQQEVGDLTQQVFQRLFESGGAVLRSWEPTRGLSLRNYVGLIAEREAASILRSGRRSPWTDDPTLNDDLAAQPDGLPPPDDHVASRDLLEQLLDALRARLSPLGLHIFQRLFVEECSVRELSAELGMTPETIHVWMSRLRKLVRQLESELTAGRPTPLPEPTASERQPLAHGPGSPTRPRQIQG